jgi:hypothetical protein
MDNLNTINVGSPENPVLVPGKALRPDSDEGKEWWEMVVSGSVNLKPDQLDNLLKLLSEKKEKDGIK